MKRAEVKNVLKEGEIAQITLEFDLERYIDQKPFSTAIAIASGDETLKTAKVDIQGCFIDANHVFASPSRINAREEVRKNEKVESLVSLYSLITDTAVAVERIGVMRQGIEVVPMKPSSGVKGQYKEIARFKIGATPPYATQGNDSKNPGDYVVFFLSGHPYQYVTTELYW